MISVLDILEDTTVDGPGFRTTIYCAGCPNHCPGCHNPESWNQGNGQAMETEEILERVLADEFANVTFSGGDPMYQAKGFTELAQAIKAKSNKNIWCYTGYLFENLVKMPDQKDEDLLFRGSANQRLIDVQASLQAGKVVLFPYDPFEL